MSIVSVKDIMPKAVPLALELAHVIDRCAFEALLSEPFDFEVRLDGKCRITKQADSIRGCDEIFEIDGVTVCSDGCLEDAIGQVGVLYIRGVSERSDREFRTVSSTVIKILQMIKEAAG